MTLGILVAFLPLVLGPGVPTATNAPPIYQPTVAPPVYQPTPVSTLAPYVVPTARPVEYHRFAMV